MRAERPSGRQLALLAVLLLPAASGFAQSDPVYPTYEGWTANPDGTYTLVFGYFNANSVAVEIRPGQANGFVPELEVGEPADRGQPVRFSPGRQRNVCRLVVPPDFVGNLQWRLSFAGTTTDTTEQGGLDPLYLLERIGPRYRATRDIDTAQTPKGRCINRAPTVSAGRDSSAAKGAPLELTGFVSDDGLPRGGALESAWSQLSGPDKATFDDPTAPRTRVRFSAAGDYELALSASDAELESRATVTIHVTAAGVR